MNRFLTYCAKAKLLKLVDSAGALGVRVESYPGGWVGIELLYSWPLDDAVLICLSPMIYTSKSTLYNLHTASIDFDYDSQEFIFSRIIENVISANA